MSLFVATAWLSLAYAHNFTHTYYYEIKDRRPMVDGKANPGFGKKNHLLGTIHSFSFHQLPPFLQQSTINHRMFLGEISVTQPPPY